MEEKRLIEDIEMFYKKFENEEEWYCKKVHLQFLVSRANELIELYEEKGHEADKRQAELVRKLKAGELPELEKEIINGLSSFGGK